MEIKEVLVVQKSPEPLNKINESSKPLTEGEIKRSNVVMGGTFTEFNKVNDNQRIYTPEVFLPHYEALKNDIVKNNGIPGEYDHPPVFELSLRNVSHFIEDLNYNKDHQKIDGKIRLTNTFYGKEAQSLVEDGFPIFVSSRAAGTTNPDGTVVIQQLFTYDLVAKPGFSSARMNMYESEMKKYEMIGKSVNESKLIKKEAKAKYEELKENFNSYVKLYEEKEILKAADIKPTLNIKDKNVKVYDLSNLSQTNQLFEMNNNDFVTKRDLELFNENLTKKLNYLNKSLKSNSSNQSPAQLKETIESIIEMQNKIADYLDYLSEETQVSYNKVANSTDKNSSRMNKLNNKVNASIAYSEHIGNTTNEIVQHNNYIVNELNENARITDKLIKENKKLNSKLGKLTEYQDYVVETMNESIKGNALLEKKLDKLISFTDYLCESIQSSIEHGDYLSEQLNNSIKYGELNNELIEMIQEHNNYLSENMNNIIDYNTYLGESLDSSIHNTHKNFDLLAEKLNETGFVKLDEYKKKLKSLNEKSDKQAKSETNNKVNETENITVKKGDWIKITGTKTRGKVLEVKEENVIYKNIKTKTNEEINIKLVSVIEKQTPSESKVDNIIKEAKKQNTSNKKADLHFLKLLTEDQKKGFYSLTKEEQRKAIKYLNENEYFDGSDVVKLISYAITKKDGINQELQEALMKFMPEEIKLIWEHLSQKEQTEFLNEAKNFYFNNNIDIANFWRTRTFNNTIYVQSMNESKTNTSLTKINEVKVDNEFMENFIREWNRINK